MIVRSQGKFVVVFERECDKETAWQKLEMKELYAR